MASRLITRAFVTLTFLLASFSIQDQGIAGGSSSHGGDNRQLLDSAAWFPRHEATKNRIIKSCFILGSKFSVQDKDRITAAIKTAYLSWYNYVAAAKHKDAINWVSSDINIEQLIDVSPSCKGQVDLKFYLGDTDKTVEGELRKFRNPATISHADRDDKAEWAKGYVWLHNANDNNPDTKFIYYHIESALDSPENFLKKSITWASKMALELAVKHEMGHIFGVPHIEDTIMDIDFLKWMPAAGLSNPKSIPILSIDRAKAILERTVEEWPLIIDGSVLYHYADIPGLAPHLHKHLNVVLRIDNDKVSIQGKNNSVPFKLELEEVDDTFLSKLPLKPNTQTALVSCKIVEMSHLGKTSYCTELKQTALIKEFRVKLIDPVEFKGELQGQTLKYDSTHHHFLISKNMGQCNRTPYGIDISEASVFNIFHKAFQVCPIW